MFNFIKEAPGGFPYLTWEEAKKKICNKCKTAYNNDWMIMDCEYCPLPDTIEYMRRYAYVLSEYKMRGLDDGK